jgi:ABC-type Mn2+/Zn2+ transport system ATPase subunit
MAQEAHVMLLDEPFTGLDVPSQEGLRKAIAAMRAAGKLLLVTHHDLETVRDLFDHVILLNGEQVAAGPVAECFTEQNLTRAFSARVFSTMRHGMAV